MTKKQGRPRRIREEEVLEVLENTNEPVLAGAEIAEELPISKRTALRRLDNLEAEDRVEFKVVGQTRAWYIPEEEPPGGVEESEEVATDGAPANAGIGKVAETVNEVHEEARMLRAEMAESRRWGGGAIIPMLLAFVIALAAPENTTATGLAGVLILIGLGSGAVWVYKQFLKKSPEERLED